MFLYRIVADLYENAGPGLVAVTVGLAGAAAPPLLAGVLAGVPLDRAYGVRWGATGGLVGSVTLVAWLAVTGLSRPAPTDGVTLWLPLLATAVPLVATLVTVANDCARARQLRDVSRPPTRPDPAGVSS